MTTLDWTRRKPSPRTVYDSGARGGMIAPKGRAMECTTGRSGVYFVLRRRLGFGFSAWQASATR